LRVPELEYVAVESWWLARLRANWDDRWGDQTPIALCARCGRRYAEDLNKDAFGEPCPRRTRRTFTRTFVATASKGNSPKASRRSSTSGWASAIGTALP
jgi:hypothetical protein